MSESQGRRRRRKWPWVLLLLVIVGVACAPRIASPFVQRAVQDALAEELGGRASFRSFWLSWPGEVGANGLQAVEETGETVFLLGSVRGSIGIWQAIRGRYDVELSINDAEVHLTEAEDGSWWLGQKKLGGEEEEAVPAQGAEADTDTDTDTDTEETDELPELNVLLELAGGDVYLHGLEGDLALLELEAAARHSGGGEPTTYALSFETEGADGTRGAFSTEGALALDAVSPAGTASLTAEGLTLAAFHPVLAASLPERVPSGSIDARLDFRGDLEEMHLKGDVKITDFEVEVETETEPLILRDPGALIDLDLELAPAHLDLSITKLAIDSSFLSGSVAGKVSNLAAWNAEAGESSETQEEEAPDERAADPVLFDGFAGEIVYQPDRLGALLEPWLPFALSGEAEERVVFRIDGEADAPDLRSLLAGCQTQATVGLGHIQAGGLNGSGTLELDAQQGGANWNGTFEANGGALNLTGDLQLASTEDGRSVLTFDAERVEANSKLAPLLSLVHPAFGVVEAIEGSEIGGLITCDVELGYDGSFASETIGTGWDEFPKERISGKGRFGIDGLRLRGTPALDEMLGYLGIDTAKSIDIRPITFSIDAGRLTYGEAWKWSIDGIRTTFTGSVGLDQTLDLSWNVPVTDELVAKHSFLDALRGTEVRLPISGTVKRPRLEWRAALEDLATRGVKEQLEDELFERLGVKQDAAGDDPGTLLSRADQLWSEGKKAEAAAIYRDIRERFKVSLVYALNRDRIKERGRYRE